MKRLLVALLLCSTPAWAQDDPAPVPQSPKEVSTGEPMSLTIAMTGVIIMSAGFGLMLHTTQPCYCEPRTAWVVGGIVVIGAGLLTTWMGLRTRKMLIYPTLTTTAGDLRRGGAVQLQWGRAP